MCTGLVWPHQTIQLCSYSCGQHSMLAFLNCGTCSSCRTGWNRLGWSACIILKYLSRASIWNVRALFSFYVKEYGQGVSQGLDREVCWFLGPLHICPTEGADVLCPLLFQNCLRRRDAGLLNQLQELDKQISDLRLDVEKTTDEHLETDSRPSSGKGSAQQNAASLGTWN